MSTETIDALEAAVKSGEIPEKQIDDSVRRLLKVKYRIGLVNNHSVDLNKVNQLVEKPENVKFANDLAERSITLLRNENKVLPLDLKRAEKTLFIIAAGDDDADQGLIFKAAIEQRVKNARVVKVDRRTTAAEYEQLLADAKQAETVLIAPFVKRAALKGTVALPDAEAEFIVQAISANKNTAIVAFGSPYQLKQFPEAKSYHGGVGGRRCRADRRSAGDFRRNGDHGTLARLACPNFSKSATVCR